MEIKSPLMDKLVVLEEVQEPAYQGALLREIPVLEPLPKGTMVALRIIKICQHWDPLSRVAVAVLVLPEIQTQEATERNYPLREPLLTMEVEVVDIMVAVEMVAVEMVGSMEPMLLALLALMVRVVEAGQHSPGRWMVLRPPVAKESSFYGFLVIISQLNVNPPHLIFNSRTFPAGAID